MQVESQQKEFHLFAPQALQDPYPLYRQMRQDAPVYYSEENRFWVLTKYRDVEAALRDDRLSADRSQLFFSQLQGVDLRKVKNFLKLFNNMMIEKDPPEHTGLRKIANRGFKEKALANWHGIVQSTVDTLLNRVKNQGRMDIVADLASPLPVDIIADIMGIAAQDRENLVKWGRDVAELWGAPTSPDMEELVARADNSAALFLGLLERIIEDRRKNRGSDMISVLIEAYETSGISLDTLPARCIELINGGHLSTTETISNGFHALLTHPEQLAKLRANPELLDSALEEVARYDAAAAIVFRIAKEPLTIRGVEIPKGSVVGLGLGAANHDPEVFTSPDEFDIERSPNEHLAFSKGTHFCIGRVLARMELRACYTSVLERMPNLRLDPDRPAVIRHTSAVFKGFQTLPVVF